MTELSVAEQTLVGRITGGTVDDLSATQVRTLLNVEDGADVTDATNVNAAGAVMESDSAGGDLGGTYPNPTVLDNSADQWVVRSFAGGAGTETLSVASAAYGSLVSVRLSALIGETASVTVPAAAVGSAIVGFANNAALAVGNTAIPSWVFGYSGLGSTVRATNGSFVSGRADNSARLEAGGAVRCGFAHGFANGSGCVIESVENGAFAQGYASGTGGYTAIVSASQRGSAAQGFTYAYQGDSNLLASADGAFAQGFANAYSAAASITASGKGSFAHGFANSQGYATAITASGAGAVAQGAAYSYPAAAYTATIEATARGGFAQGYAYSYTATTAVSATGKGAFAQGYAHDTTIVASATNSVQFGPGTNAEPDSLQTGSGIRIFGTTSPPSTPKNGDIYCDGTDVFFRSGGAWKNASSIP